MDSGVYQIVFELTDNVISTIGSLGHFVLPAGYYIYTGKANNRMNSIISRHRLKKKKIRFHLDYLSIQSAFRIDKIFIYPDIYDSCLIHQLSIRETGGHELIPRFGNASDDNCFSHLLYLPGNPSRKLRRLKNSFKQEKWEMNDA